jgi:hypothetical protein
VTLGMTDVDFDITRNKVATLPHFERTRLGQLLDQHANEHGLVWGNVADRRVTRVPSDLGDYLGADDLTGPATARHARNSIKAWDSRIRWVERAGRIFLWEEGIRGLVHEQ